MNLNEQNLSRLFRFFQMSTCAFVSAEISMDTVAQMEALGRHDFFEHFSKLTGKKVAVGQTSDITPEDIKHYNHKAGEGLRKTPIPFVKVRGAYSYNEVDTSMESTCVFIGITNAQAANLAAQFYQQAYIFVNRGTFYYLDATDYKNYTITTTARSEDGHLPVQVKGKHTHHEPKDAQANRADGRDDNPNNLFKLGDGPAKAGTIHGNKSFVIRFDQAPGADTLESMELLTTLHESEDRMDFWDIMVGTRFTEDFSHIMVPSAGPRTADQAKHEAMMWVEEARHHIERQDWKSADHALAMAKDYTHALNAQAN